MRKKKILIHSNHSRAFTGFGKNTRNILSFLMRTGKFEVIEAANGKKYSDPILKTAPWKALGTLPDDDALLHEINQNHQRSRSAGYGHEMIDKIIADEKPDVYIGMEDIWAFEGFYEKDWWNKTNCMIWTTLDSLPILPGAINPAALIKHYYVWASFAEREMKNLGINHVNTLRGSLDTQDFYKLPSHEIAALKNKYQIPQDCFITGFVFRNQLRKSVPNLLDGFKLFKEKNPKTDCRLLLHTHWGEGWDIPRLIMEKKMDPQSILTTYFCKNCGEYEIKPFNGQEQNCRFCGSQKSQNTTNVAAGVNEAQLNEIYNLMDVYCHPFTSGGQEIPIQEAKLTELITLVTNYSCGEDCCTAESGGLPLDWSEYREPGTQFIKASTSPKSIERNLSKVFKMPPQKREEWGKRARKFTIDNFSTEVIGEQLVKILDEMPYLEEGVDLSIKPKNPDFKFPQIKDDTEFIKTLYENILNRQITEDYAGYKHWLADLQKNKNRQAIYDFFIKTAKEHNSKTQTHDITQLLDEDDEGQRILVMAPSSGSTVLYALAVLEDIKNQYPTYNIYFATHLQFIPLLDGNSHIHKAIIFHPSMNNCLALEGMGDNKGHFQIVYNGDALATNFHINSHHNNEMSLKPILT